MAESGNQIEQNGGAAATASLAPGALAPEPMLLQVPAPGAVLTVSAVAGGVYAIDPAAQGLGLEMAWRGEDLVLAFSGAGSIQIQSAANLADADTPPLVVLADGTELGVDRLFAALDTETAGAPLETAAGPETAAGGDVPDEGFHGYTDTQGESVIDGLVGTGALGAGAFFDPSSFDLQGDQRLDGENGNGTSGGGTSPLSGAGSGDGSAELTAGGTGGDASASGAGGSSSSGGGGSSASPSSSGGSAASGSESGGGSGASSSGGGSGESGSESGSGSGASSSGGGSGESGSESGGGSGSSSSSGGSGGGSSGGKGGGNSQAQSDDDGPGLSGDDTITGGDDADHLVGGANADILDGGAGDDTLNGSAGNDTLIGGLGDDELQGGSGADVFLFDFGDNGGDFGSDVVRDFDADAGDVLSFVNVIDSTDGDSLDDLLSSMSVDDDGRDVTVNFDSGATIVFEGIGTGGIDTATELLNEFGQINVEAA